MTPDPDDELLGDKAVEPRPVGDPRSMDPGAAEWATELFPVVAVGGSAGSLTPFQELLSHLPAEPLVAVVIVSHQDPDRPSLLPEILAKSTPMAVSQVSDGDRAEPGHVHVAPPGRFLSIHEGVFHLERATERGHPPLPIDFFMRSLADERRSRAVGVVVSGTGSDGSLGLAAIRHEAGLTLAQPPDEAEFDGMPGNAIAAGVVDLVLAPAEMAERLTTHARRLAAGSPPLPETSGSTDDLERILELVTARTGRDFSAYKRGTLQRRIERRLHLHGLQNLSEYLHFTEARPEELDALWRDWLIGVSGFFRDPEAFEALEAELFEMVRSRPDGSPLRVWVPGCATGQEAYSIAILLLEALKTTGRRLDLQIFATDLDEAAIDAARAGRYSEGIAADILPERLQRFFVVEDRHFVVKQDVREQIVFAVQDLLHDPPFTRLDLISCRNLLIYLRNDAQKRILPLFHYSLDPNGLLLLGNSESVIGFEDLFSPVDREQKIFRRNEIHRAAHTPRDWAARPRPTHPVRRVGLLERESPTLDLGDILRRQLADRYAPPGLIVDEDGNVEQIHGRTGDYLEPAPGQANLNLLDMAREGLRAPLAAALREVAHGGERTAERDARVQRNGGRQPVHVRVTRLAHARLPRPLFLVSFEPPEEPVSLPEGAKDRSEGSDGRVSSRDRVVQLEEELRATRIDHHSTMRELQASNEELASANEEVQSVNEELQSTNEELQTSKEETQSLNEELQTMNAELRTRVSSLEQVNDDIRNLMDSTEIAIVFTDGELRVKRFTPSAQAVVPLIASDVGRPLSDISISVDYPDLLTEAKRTLRTLTPSLREVSTDDGDWYSVEIRPYRKASGFVDGLSIAFLGITRTKRAERTAQLARALGQDILDTLREPFLVLNADLTVERANQAFYQAFGAEPEETVGKRIFDLGDGQWEIPRLRELLEQLLPKNQAFDDYEVDHEFPTIGRRVMLLNARRVKRSRTGDPDLILLAIEDVTGRAAEKPRDGSEARS
ncbi:MAG: PAS domain-containing protein [Myxococcales bacterium]|nr:PAS domain-containing protein [Myxococcales bacterium]